MNREGSEAQLKRLDIERIRAIKEETAVFLTLHGASGTDDDDLRRAIAAGITVVHMNTELRLAWRRSLEDKRSGPIQDPVTCPRFRKASHQLAPETIQWHKIGENWRERRDSNSRPRA